MNKRLWIVPLVLVGVIVTSAAALKRGSNEVELSKAKVFIEFNSTDNDFGIQFFWDGAPWKRMKVENPCGQTVLDVKVSNNLKLQGLTEGFFESAEPPTSVLSMAQFFARFPEGEYEFEGRTLNNQELEGETEFTHTLPAPPTNLSPSNVVINHMNPLVLTFNAVTQDLQSMPLVPELYEVILETEDGILKVFSIILEGDVANPSVTVPPEFLTAGTEYKFEVIVQEESGNRTIAETTFETQ